MMVMSGGGGARNVNKQNQHTKSNHSQVTTASVKDTAHMSRYAFHVLRGLTIAMDALAPMRVAPAFNIFIASS